MRFADFYVGQRLTHGPASLSEDEIVAFARDWDPQWFHTDPERAAVGPHGGLIASGWQTCGLAMRMATECALIGSESFASPGVEHIRWLQPVRPGMPLHFHAHVLEKRRSSKRRELGVLRWEWALRKEDGPTMMELIATSFFLLCLQA